MAVDSSLYAADIPAASYAVGDVIQLVNVAGPANVRSGRGSAILKQILCARLGGGNPQWEIRVKNSDWIDEVASYAGQFSQTTGLDDHSGLIQFGCDNSLTANSGWQIYAVCKVAGTSTVADSLIALIDIDYPQVSAISDPDTLVGTPTSIDYDVNNVPVFAYGSVQTASWTTQSVDYLKAGYQYCIQAVEALSLSGNVTAGFLAFSNAAGMGGLQRIIPVTTNIHSIRYKLRYASKLEKGPMEVKTMFFATTAGTASVSMIHDYVKRSA